MSIQLRPMEFSDFSGGITDEYVDGPTNCYQKGDNFIITNAKKLKTRAGSEIFSADAQQINQGSQRINALMDLNTTIFAQALKSIHFIDTTFQTLLGPNGSEIFDRAEDGTQVSFTKWNNHLILTNKERPLLTKIYKDDNGDYQARTAGLPALATTPTLSSAGGSGNNYIYAFLYYSTYNVGDVEFQDFGPTLQVEKSNIGAPDANAVSISAIPVISSSGNNWDTSNIKVRIYRTVDNGQVLFKIGEVTNGTTVFSDTISDATAETGDIIYTDGGILDNDPPPRSKFIHILNDICWYGAIEEDNVFFPSRIRQSVALDFDSCPKVFFTDLDDNITGISSVQDFPIFFCESSIFRIEGAFDELGREGFVAKRISTSVGCVSHNSIVKTSDGVYFAGQDGFYFCDGSRVLKITEHLDSSYSDIVSDADRSLHIYGVLDEKHRKIYWSCQREDSSLDNDSWFILDLVYGLKPESTFTTASGTKDSFRPSSVLYYQGDILRGDIRGFLLRHKEDLHTDAKINDSVDPDDWDKNTIIWDYKSIATSFGSAGIRKWVPKMSIVAKNESNVSIQVTKITDDGRMVQKILPILFTSNIEWGDPTIIWGDPDIIWNQTKMIDALRRFDAQALRCNFCQLEITNANDFVQISDVFGTATVNNTANTVTLDTSGNEWIANAVDYSIFFDNDNYTNEFIITDRTSTVLTFDDPGNVAPTGSRKWQIKGFKKDAILHLISFAIHYGFISSSQTPYTGTTGGNAS